MGGDEIKRICNNEGFHNIVCVNSGKTIKLKIEEGFDIDNDGSGTEFKRNYSREDLLDTCCLGHGGIRGDEKLKLAREATLLIAFDKTRMPYVVYEVEGYKKANEYTESNFFQMTYKSAIACKGGKITKEANKPGGTNKKDDHPTFAEDRIKHCNMDRILFVKKNKRDDILRKIKDTRRGSFENMNPVKFLNQ